MMVQTDRTPAVLLLDLEASSLAGIDLLSFTITPRFRGIKDLPSGLHFIFTGSSNAFSVRHGIWFLVRKHRDDPQYLLITRWKPDAESLITELDQAENQRWRANIGEFWREGLTAYRQSASDELSPADNDWASLTLHISPDVLSRITKGDSDHWTLTSASSAVVDIDDIPGIKPEDFTTSGGEELGLLPIDLKRTWRAGATGRERTDAAMDRSWALDNLVQTHIGGSYEAVIGELQFCFLMTLTLNNWSCFEQWKRILALVFTSRASVVAHPDFFVRFIASLRLQIQHIKDAEGGLIDMNDEGESLLKDLLVRFRKGVKEVQTLDCQDVLDELDDLEAYLRNEYGWEFGGTFAKSGTLQLEDGEQVRMDTTTYDEDDEDGEYAPQIVDLTPEEARLLNIDNSPTLLDRLASAGLDERKLAQTQQVLDASSEDEMSEESADLDDLDQRY